MNKIAVNLGMLGSNINSSLADVIMKWNRIIYQDTEISEQAAKPFEFTQSHCHRIILNLSKRTRNDVLFLCFLRDGRIT